MRKLEQLTIKLSEAMPITNMSLLIKRVKIIDKQSARHGAIADILIENGIITKIESDIEHTNATVWQPTDACVSIGWLDLGTQVGDPGYEHKEDLQSATAAAAAGGFTSIACASNTHPVIHSKSEVLYIKNLTRSNLVDVYPIGAVSKNGAGEDLAELYDMHRAGAIAFSDGHHPVQNNGLMLRSLLYAKSFDGLILNHPHDNAIAGKGYVHEGIISTSLGLKGIPALSEEMMVQRDLHLVEYSEAKLHFFNISSAGSVALIQAAKHRGLKVTASVNPMNLVFDDSVLMDFDTNYKVYPPLRSKRHLMALIKGLKDGTIDLICTNHTPQAIENKHLEFAYADFGVIMLDTAYAVLNTYLELSQDILVEKLAVNPRQLLDLDQPTIEIGAKANLTIFEPSTKWTFTRESIQSKSHNSPFLGKSFTGKVFGVVNNGQHRLTDEVSW